MKWWEAGTVVVEVSGYKSCTDHCSYGTSRSDLMRRRLSKACVIVKPSLARELASGLQN